MSTNMPNLNIATRSNTIAAEGNGLTGNFRGFVTDTFKVSDRLSYSNNQTQVTGSGLTAGKNAHTFFVDGNFHLINAFVGAYHLLGNFQVCVNQCMYCIVNLTLRKAAHFRKMLSNIVQLDVVLLGNMMCMTGNIHNKNRLRLNRNDR